MPNGGNVHFVDRCPHCKSKSALSLIVMIIFVLSLSLISVSCRFPPGKGLPFETIVPENNRGDDSLYKEESAQIRVVSEQLQLNDTNNWIRPYYRDELEKVDFSKYFVVMVFNGYRGGISSYFNILKIRQHNGDIFILAHFNDRGKKYDLGLQAENSQYQVVKISNQLITTGKAYTFRVFDESKVERARTTAAISDY